MTYEGGCTPTTPNAPPTLSAQAEGQRTGIISSSGSATVHPQAEKSSQPPFMIRCSSDLSGRPAQSQSA
eukprot:CAMPEP_0113827904 /NCGR_PEP_ID=MMETSP0328-20130328/5005_1 /TAXON_ID=39455 /ORGANISM="Alexandrium minutum" /LENGTH=68 /DNA_ID=CAMNT_0000795903 /DNA_START=427 /DNA_END=630 /DNA_ORIENTATION=+ /assembly_acc=CAM_ASM_000350